jgi:non-heme chloroperoxidase
MNSTIHQAIISGEQKHTGIKVPTLAIFAVPHDQGPYAHAHSSPAATANTVVSEGFAKAFEIGVPSARVVRIPHANHYVFMSNEAEVLREMHAFLAGFN